MIYSMLQIAHVFAFFAAAVLLVAGAAWLIIARTPEKEEAVAGHPLLDSRRVRSAAMAMAVAFGLSVVAAFFAILTMFTSG